MMYSVRVIPFSLLLLGALLIGQSATAASSSAKMSVDSKLYSASNLRSSVVSKLPQGSEVTIIKRKGAWYQVKANGSSGWVRSYDVQMNSSANWFSRFKRVIAGGYSSQSNASATIGIRGLGPGDVKKAAPDPKQLARLDSYRKTIRDGRQYAAKIPLQARKVQYLSAHTSASRSVNTKSNQQPPARDKKQQDNDVLQGVGEALKGLF